MQAFSVTRDSWPPIPEKDIITGLLRIPISFDTESILSRLKLDKERKSSSVVADGVVDDFEILVRRPLDPEKSLRCVKGGCAVELEACFGE